MKSYILIFILGIIPLIGLSGSKITVSGKITETGTNEPLVYVTILIKGTTTGVLTDIDGNYNVTASIGDTIICQYIGYETKEIEIKSDKLDI